MDRKSQTGSVTILGTKNEINVENARFEATKTETESPRRKNQALI